MSVEERFKVNAVPFANSSSSSCQTLLLSRAVRKRLRKYLSRLDQSNLDLTFPAFALNNPITAFLDDDWMIKKTALDSLLFRRNSFVTELALWNGGPIHGGGIKAFLDYFLRRPFVNLVSVDFSTQCLSVADYFTYFGDHQMPQLRRLSLTLYHRPDLLLGIGINAAERNAFPVLDEASIRFTEKWCHICYFSILHHLRNTSQLALRDVSLLVEDKPCSIMQVHLYFPNLRKLRVSLKSFLLSEDHGAPHHFPTLELVVIEWFELDGYLRNLSKYNSLFPTARVHFSVYKDRRAIGWSRCGACTRQPSARKELAFANPPDYATETGAPVVNFRGCSELYISGDQIIPLSFNDVYLHVYLKDIMSHRVGTLRRSAIEEVLLKADVGVTHLQFSSCWVSVHNFETLPVDLGTAARLKVMPLLAIQRQTLVSLEISEELVFGCLTNMQSLRQVWHLRGQLSNVCDLVITSETGLVRHNFDLGSITIADLKPLLEMFPRLRDFEIQRGNHIRGVNVRAICAICPNLQVLRCYSESHEDDWATGSGLSYRLDTLHWSIGGNFTDDHLTKLPDSVHASFVLLNLKNSEIALKKEDVEDIFARMSCLACIVLLWEEQEIIWICRRSADVQTIDLASANVPWNGYVVNLCPQLFSKIWSSITRVECFSDDEY